MRLNWKVTVFSVVCLGVFLRLGFWQLAREEEKISLLAARDHIRAEAPLELSALPAADAATPLQPVTGKGRYDEEAIFLLDNRVLNGTVGFEVLVPFEVAEVDRWVLVNRGFVPMARTRSDAPAIPPITATGRLFGELYVRPAGQPTPDEVSASLTEDLTIVQVADPALIGRLVGVEMYPHVVRLARADANALPRHWPVTVMQPEKHRGYAVQWFAMAVAVFIAWSAFTFAPLVRGSNTEIDHE